MPSCTLSKDNDCEQTWIPFHQGDIYNTSSASSFMCNVYVNVFEVVKALMKVLKARGEWGKIKVCLSWSMVLAKVVYMYKKPKTKMISVHPTAYYFTTKCRKIKSSIIVQIFSGGD